MSIRRAVIVLALAVVVLMGCSEKPASLSDVFPDADVVSSQLFSGEHANLNYDLRLTSLMAETVLKVYSDISSVQLPQ